MGLPARWECRTGGGRDLSSSLRPPRCPVRVARVVVAEAPPPPPSVQPQKTVMEEERRSHLWSGLALTEALHYHLHHHFHPIFVFETV